MKSGVYGLFSPNGECLYVGQSSNIDSRWRQHLKELRSGRHKRKGLVEWFNTFGEESLELRVLIMCSNDQDLKNSLEIVMFNYHKPKFYGQTPSENCSFSQSNETRSKISVSVLENTKHTRVKTICVCGVEFTYNISRVRKFCSTKCSSENRPRKTDIIDIEDLKLRYNSGMTLNELGKHYGFSYRSIHQLMVNNDIPRR